MAIRKILINDCRPGETQSRLQICIKYNWLKNLLSFVPRKSMGCKNLKFYPFQKKITETKCSYLLADNLTGSSFSHVGRGFVGVESLDHRNVSHVHLLATLDAPLRTEQLGIHG